MKVRAWAPGRVNLIGDHTDYTGGLVLPMAVDRGTTVELERGGPWVELVSTEEPEPAFVILGTGEEPRQWKGWARYVAGVVDVLRPEVGGIGVVTTTLPVGAGLSSSAALEVAVALALGYEGSALDLALLCQEAEHRASGVPSGIMDQLASAAGVEGHALLIDCASLEVAPVPMPDDVEVVVVDSGQRRALAESHYGVRRTQCEEAAAIVGPLRQASLAAVEGIEPDDLRRRARHVVSENARVEAFAGALRSGDVVGAGELMVESHASLRDDFEVSTPTLDRLVEAVLAIPGVLGARLTGAGFGGCVVALVRSGTDLGGDAGGAGKIGDNWRVRPSAGARVEVLGRGG